MRFLDARAHLLIVGDGDLRWQYEERARQNGVSGSGSGTGYTCDGQPQRVVVPVTASAGFQKGSAVASLSVSWS